MHELVTRALYYLHIHLLYASIVWLAAWVLTSIGPGSATAKYWIWVATSLNFIVPAGAIVDKLGANHLSWAAPLGVLGDAAAGISGSPAAPAIFVLWLLGAVLMLRRVLRRIRSERRDARSDAGYAAPEPRPAFLADGVPVRFAPARQAPAVDGILRPRISLPDGIERLLTGPELDAVLAHEVTHARRRDNLIRLVHEVGLCGLWFHPLVWITGARIALYRELSCDESVLRNARGRDLVSALAKLAAPEEPFLLQATASSFIGRRLAGLAATRPRRSLLAANVLLAGMFGSTLLAGVYGTVAHTACCFVAKDPGSATRSRPRRTDGARNAAALAGIEHGIGGRVSKGIRGGVRGGIRGGIEGGIAGGVSGGIAGGIQRGTEGGVAGGVSGGMRAVQGEGAAEADALP